jgi:hypothetical protein
MKIEITFDSWEEMEIFRTSGKRTRGKKDEVDEPASAPVEQMAQSIRDAQPLGMQPATAPVSSFPGANGPTPSPAAVNPVITAILARIDGAVASGQPPEVILTWFRQQIGPDAKDATLDQIKQVFVPRMSKAQLDQLAPQLGISVQ